MVNISKFFSNNTRNLLDEGVVESVLRPYLGMSQLGHSCDRFLWYSFRWAFKNTYSRRIHRLFAKGHREEAIIVKDLERIGVKFSGDQDEVACAWEHCKGHRDGMVENVPEAPKTPHLAEFKTMSDKYFKAICKKGLKESKPIYYAQCQIYMKFFKLTRTLFIAVNKNDDSYYVERIKYDAAFAKLLVRKAENIIMYEFPPAKRFSPTWYECKYCPAFDICHRHAEVERNCRTCRNCEPGTHGSWMCTIGTPTPGCEGAELSTIIQRKGCDKYVKFLEMK